MAKKIKQRIYTWKYGSVELWMTNLGKGKYTVGNRNNRNQKDIQKYDDIILAEQAFNVWKKFWDSILLPCEVKEN